MDLELRLHSPAGSEPAVYKWPLPATVNRPTLAYIGYCEFVVSAERASNSSFSMLNCHFCHISGGERWSTRNYGYDQVSLFFHVTLYNVSCFDSVA